MSKPGNKIIVQPPPPVPAKSRFFGGPGENFVVVKPAPGRTVPVPPEARPPRKKPATRQRKP